MSVSLNRWSAHPYYFINGDLDFRVIKALNNEMSYFIEGFEKTKKYKEGRWDGKESLLYKSKKGVYFFPAGLIDVVKRVFNDFEVDYFTQDIKLDNVKKKYKKLNLKWTIPFDLYDYQQKSVIDIQNNEGGVICLPTGAGKSLIMSRIAYEYDLPFIIIVHTKELLYQWEKNIKEAFDGVCPGLVGDGYSNFEPITIGMLQTISQMIGAKKLTDLDYPIFMMDECHRIPSDTAYTVSMHCNAPVRIGASATPMRTDGADKKIWAAVGEIKSRITADELIKRGILARPHFVFLTPPAVFAGHRAKWQDAYLHGIVLNEDRNNMIVRKAKEYAAEGLTVYVHVERIDHGDILSSRIPGSVFLSGKDNSTRRQLILKEFAAGKIKVLISTLLKEGVNIPSMNVFIAGGAGKSPIGVLQKAGRALRVAPGKTEAIIVDFRDSGRYLGDHFSERYDIYKSTFGDYCP